jgi:hypothetical protein
LRRWARLLAGTSAAFLLLVAAGCQAPVEPDEPATASRAEVTLALYRQLEFVLRRHDILATELQRESQLEREELVRLAAEIAVRIVRVDPEADVDALVLRMESLR